MSENTKTCDASTKLSYDNEINLLQYLLIIVKHKKTIFYTGLITLMISSGLTLLMPNIYTSTSRILPSQESSSNLGTMLSGGVGDLAALVGLSNNGASSALYVAMLQSRTITDAVIEKLGLMDEFKWKSMTLAYTQMLRRVIIEIGKRDGVITISFSSRDPELAAKVVNTYVSELQTFNAQRNLNEAGKERLFLEGRLDIVKADLLSSEESLQTFQEKNKAIRIDAQASAIIEAIAQLKGELASKEVELGVLLSSQTEKNPQVIALREGIAQVKEQLSRLERSPGNTNASTDIFLATSVVPELGIQYARLLREFKVQETLYELLMKQYELAKIAEAKNTTTIQILDKGVAADKKSKPKRSLIVLFVTFVMVFFAVIYVFFDEYGQRMSSADRLLWKEITRQAKFWKKG